MPEYLSPGVYVEEIDAGPKPIEGVSTSTAGAVGVTSRGPTSGKPELVTSFAEFVRKFGSFLEEPDPAIFNKWALDQTEGGRWWHFPLTVKGFFDNGGQRLYLKRVFANSAVASKAPLGAGVVSHIAKDQKMGADTLELEHLISIAEQTAVKIFHADGTQVGAGFVVKAYDPQTRRITLTAALPGPVRAGDFVEIFTRTPSAGTPTAAQTTLNFTAKARGAWGDDVSVYVRPMFGATLNLLYNPNLPNAGKAAVAKVVAAAPLQPGTTNIQFDDVTDFDNGDHVVIKGHEYALSNKNAAAKTFDIAPAIPAGETWEQDTPIRRLRPVNAAAMSKVHVSGAAQLYEDAIVELDNGHQKETRTVSTISGDEIDLSGGNLANLYFEGHRLRVVEALVRVRYAPGGVEEATESFSNLRLIDDGSLSYLVRNVNLQSQLVDVNIPSAGAFSATDITKFPIAPGGAWQQLGGGDDKYDQLAVDDFVGVDGGSGKRTGIQALEDIDEISICLAPAIWSATVQSALIQHCETLKDRFAIIDPRDGLSIEGIRAFREPIDTKYAALYYPWIEVRDPSVRRNVIVAPSAHMAGIYARVDVERGVHKAPANEVIRGITKIADDVTKREQDMLNPKGINALRFFPGRSNRVWGARTLTSDMSWKYINVRRLFIFVEESIDEGTQWVVFEPNDEPLWARVRQTITNFLTTVWRNGALEGTKPDEAFFVRCDRTTMSQDDIDNGKLICLIGIAPVKPAEFVIFRIQQKTRDAKVA